MIDREECFWSVPSDEVIKGLQTTPNGLEEDEAKKRLSTFGLNRVTDTTKKNTYMLLISQFTSPIILILLLATVLSIFVGDITSALIIIVIILISGLLSFWQEKGAVDALEKLQTLTEIKTKVIREGKTEDIPVDEVVPGDIISLSAGDIIPGDCLLLEAKDLFIDEAMLTGETYPVEKSHGLVDKSVSLNGRTNSLYKGTHVVSGNAKTVVVYTGKETEFGKISDHLKLRPPETDFQRGVRRFGYMLMEVTLVLVIIIFAINVYFNKPVLNSFLFALALAVGLIPQLLPAIISVNLAHGAKRMYDKKVIVKRLASIENFGTMTVLCTDKTGTLTEGIVTVDSSININGEKSQKVALYSYLNAFYQSGFTNPIDEAIKLHNKDDITAYKKLDEVPYDFLRKRLSIFVSGNGKNILITKGALQKVLEVCNKVELADGSIIDINTMSAKVNGMYEKLSNDGFRVIGVGYKEVNDKKIITKVDENDMIFLGFLILCDPIKTGVTTTITDLQKLGIKLKIITGDNRLVASHIGQQLGKNDLRILTGSELREIGDNALIRQVNEIDIFAEIEPNQKERIILSLKKSGNVVGYMGDGINDAPALHAADVGISVDSAVDVAKEAADIVLLEKDLEVLVDGVIEGRKTFANTMKYVFMATSANFGNMFSMAGASIFMSFLPMLPEQILLTNLMTDFPEMTISTDGVDPELIERPRRWNIKFIRNFMITFGSISSIFDFVTFVVLLEFLQANPSLFRTGWFVESVVSAALIVLVIRTRRAFFLSKPGKYLLIATLMVVVITFILPFTSLGKIMGFTPLPLLFLGVIGIIIIIYIAMAELAKIVFYSKVLY